MVKPQATCINFHLQKKTQAISGMSYREKLSIQDERPLFS